MKLQNHKFYQSGKSMRFEVYSDDSCRSCHLDTIHLTWVRETVHVYEIVPGAHSNWIIVRQKDGEQLSAKLFLRRGQSFFEDHPLRLKKTLKQQIARRFPNLTPDLGEDRLPAGRPRQTR